MRLAQMTIIVMASCKCKSGVRAHSCCGVLRARIKNTTSTLCIVLVVVVRATQKINTVRSF